METNEHIGARKTQLGSLFWEGGTRAHQYVLAQICAEYNAGHLLRNVDQLHLINVFPVFGSKRGTGPRQSAERI